MEPFEPTKRGLLDRIDGATPATAFGIGLVLAVINPTWPSCWAG